MDWFEQMGLPFAQIEAMGIQIPVVSCAARYHVSAKFGDTVEIYLACDTYNGVRLKVSYEVRSKTTGTLLATGASEHCFLNSEGKVLNLARKFPQVDQIFKTSFSYRQ